MFLPFLLPITSTLEDKDKAAYTHKIICRTSEFEPTSLGRAMVASALTPEDGIFVHKELKKPLQAFVVDGEMHVLCVFTSVSSILSEVNWQVFRKVIDSLDESGLRALRIWESILQW